MADSSCSRLQSSLKNREDARRIRRPNRSQNSIAGHPRLPSFAFARGQTADPGSLGAEHHPPLDRSRHAFFNSLQTRCFCVGLLHYSLKCLPISLRLQFAVVFVSNLQMSFAAFFMWCAAPLPIMSFAEL